MNIANIKSGYGQFCPVAKASEIFATRWTPLVVAVNVARAARRTAAAAGRAGNRREKNPRGRPGPRILADSGGRIRPRDRARPRPLGSCSYTRPHQC
jgi:hypothetical protein